MWTLTVSCALNGCATKPVPVCTWVKPILISRAELGCMTTDTKKQILTHNETWEAMQ